MVENVFMVMALFDRCPVDSGGLLLLLNRYPVALSPIAPCQLGAGLWSGGKSLAVPLRLGRASRVAIALRGPRA